MPHKPPLQIHVLHHPESEGALLFAREMFRRFAGTPDFPAMRIPVGFVPDRGDGLPPTLEELDLDGAEHTVVVALADSRMARRVDGGTQEQWGQFLTELLARCPVGKTAHYAMPVALDGRAFEVADQLSLNSFVRLDVLEDEPARMDELFFQMSVRALQLLTGKQATPAGDVATAPLQVFISHAKGDLPRSVEELPEGERQGPVFEILSYLARNPVDAWYDAKHIPPGGRFDREIQAGVLNTSALIAVVTDQFASRPWCREEVQAAKRAGRPIVRIDALEHGEDRSQAYGGNVPTLPWSRTGDRAFARRAVALAIKEALRHEFALRSLQPLKRPGQEVLASPPELFTVTRLPEGTTALLYPDPPLPVSDTQTLRDVHPKLELETPLSRLAGLLPAEQKILVGLSLSTSTDIRQFGGSLDHVCTATDDISRLLLLAGARIAYGGRIGGADENDPDFTVRLFGQVRSFSPHAKEVYEQDLYAILNYVGWPLHLRYGDNELNEYGREADIVRTQCPESLGVTMEALDAREGEFFPPAAADPAVQAARRFAWGRGMTLMREQMTEDNVARVCVGGNLQKYVGQLPGVVEECLVTLRARKPLYLIGAFGGATRLVGDIMLGGEREELSDAWARENVPSFAAVDALYRAAGLASPTPDAARDEIRRAAAGGLAQALNNGLDDAANRELFTCRDPFRITELLLLGLQVLRG